MWPLARRHEKHKPWHRTLIGVIIAWGRHQIWRIVGAILALWLSAAIVLHLIEPPDNTAFATWGEALWNVWGLLFGAGNAAPGDDRRQARRRHLDRCRRGSCRPIHGERCIHSH